MFNSRYSPSQRIKSCIKYGPDPLIPSPWFPALPIYCPVQKGASMNRRHFLYGATAFTSLAHASPSPAITIRLSQPGRDWPIIPADFIGLSYETGQLYNPDFFSPRNQPLIDAFRRLNSNGVLRLGGHLSNITPWQGVGLDDPKQIRGVRHGIEDYWE